MTIIGRTTKDAQVKMLTNGRKVVLFSIAGNDRYRLRGGDPVKTTTYYDCSYWLSQKLAAYLKKGTLVEVSGRIYVAPYISKNGEAKASLKCHTSGVRIHGWPKETKGITQHTADGTDPADPDDLPF